jgi:hypothetical protein
VVPSGVNRNSRFDEEFARSCPRDSLWARCRAAFRPAREARRRIRAIRKVAIRIKTPAATASARKMTAGCRALAVGSWLTTRQSPSSAPR